MSLHLGVATFYVIVLRVPLPFSLASRYPTNPGCHLQLSTPTVSKQAHPLDSASIPGPLVHMNTPRGPREIPAPCSTLFPVCSLHWIRGQLEKAGPEWLLSWFSVSVYPWPYALRQILPASFPGTPEAVLAGAELAL